jgi:hypothetical protein
LKLNAQEEIEGKLTSIQSKLSILIVYFDNNCMLLTALGVIKWITYLSSLVFPWMVLHDIVILKKLVMFFSEVIGALYKLSFSNIAEK